MRMRISLLAVSGVMALLAVAALSFEDARPGTGPKADAAACAALGRAMPEGHPPLTSGSDGLPCEITASPLGADMRAERSAMARYAAPRAPVFDHVSLISADGAPVSVLGDCAGCHAETQVLPEDHVPTAEMPMAQCRACHAPQTELSLRGEMPLDHVHGLSGVACTACHVGEETAMTEPPMEVCQACHGTLEELAAATADVHPTNPHTSPHGAPYAECSLCHRQHQPSENFCASCHDFDFDLP